MSELHLARVRRICAELPETSERLSHGEPTFFVHKKVFAMFANNHHNDGHVAVWLPVPTGLQPVLIESDPGTYYNPPYVGVRGWVGVELGQVSDTDLALHSVAVKAEIELPCSDAAVLEKTGRDWSGWCAVLDADDAAKLSHKDLAVLISQKHSGGDWWSQTVAVGYERLRGKRAVGQKSDGKFSASVSKTLPIDAARAFECFVDEARRSLWLAETVVIRSATAPRSVRITWPDQSSVDVWITDRGGRKCSVAIEHRKLADQVALAGVKEFWQQALGRLVASGASD